MDCVDADLKDDARKSASAQGGVNGVSRAAAQELARLLNRVELGISHVASIVWGERYGRAMTHPALLAARSQSQR